ncbi:hypothetical protein [Synechococcus sp. R6-6]|uniref:hypothetical protein n=1 Tax=unclassified Synechococcus TaxID=2626047 RepID=UPI0039C3BE80
MPELAQRASDPIEVELHHAADESSLSFAVAGVELAVDMETGQIELLIASAGRSPLSLRDANANASAGRSPCISQKLELNRDVL